MNDPQPPQRRDPAIARRRRILYAATLMALIAIAAVAIVGLLDQPKPRKPRRPPVTPVILARVELKPVRRASGSGIAEILRRGDQQSLRVLATGLRPSGRDRIYQLVLAGGSADRLLGSAVVGAPRIFVGESKLELKELQRHRFIELRLSSSADQSETVLRGRIPR